MRSMRWVLIGVVAVLVSCGGGSSSSNSEASSTTSEASSTTSEASSTSTVTEIEVVYKVGDTGPGGGIIVYVDVEGFTNSGDETSIGVMCLTGTCHYLEMAPTDLNDVLRWSDAINGSENYSTATADDWVLPSRDALRKMCKYALGETRIGNDNNDDRNRLWYGSFSSDWYWSSSKSSDRNACNENMRYGFQACDGSNCVKLAYVRPVRAI